MITDLDRLKVDTIRLPDWLPPLVAHQVCRLITGDVNPEIGGLAVAALIFDPRMRRVWTELRKKNKETGAYRYPSSIGPDNAESRQNYGMMMLFQAAFAFAKLIGLRTVPLVGMIDTRGEIEARRAKFLGEAGKLRRIAEISGSDPSFAAAAAAYERLAAQAFPVVERDTGDRTGRWLVMELGGVCRAIFGSTKVNTVATIASVMLRREILPRTARGWCDELPGSGDCKVAIDLGQARLIAYAIERG